MTHFISCAHCGSAAILSVDNNGWPLYYFGAGPNNPQNAEVYFCDVYCANNYVKEQQNGKKR